MGWTSEQYFFAAVSQFKTVIVVVKLRISLVNPPNYTIQNWEQIIWGFKNICPIKQPNVRQNTKFAFPTFHQPKEVLSLHFQPTIDSWIHKVVKLHIFYQFFLNWGFVIRWLWIEIYLFLLSLVWFYHQAICPFNFSFKLHVFSLSQQVNHHFSSPECLQQKW